jgi:hypothetical protein
MMDQARLTRSSEQEEAVAAVSGGVRLGLTLTAPPPNPLTPMWARPAAWATRPGHLHFEAG